MAARKIEEIILHCTATKEGNYVDVKMVDKWHRDRGFKCIGYHYLIYLDGSIHVGRKESEVGAHCLNHNQNSIGVCYVGGLDKNMKPKDTRTDAQKKAMAELLLQLVRKYPDASVHGHYEFAAKACPCFDVQQEYKFSLT